MKISLNNNNILRVKNATINPIHGVTKRDMQMSFLWINGANYQNETHRTFISDKLVETLLNISGSVSGSVMHIRDIKFVKQHSEHNVNLWLGIEKRNQVFTNDIITLHGQFNFLINNVNLIGIYPMGVGPGY